MRLGSPLLVVFDRVFLEEGHQLIQAPIEIVRGKKLIMQGAQSPKKHVLGSRGDEHPIKKFVRLPSRQRKLTAADKRMHRVGIRCSIPILIRDDHIRVQSIRTKCEIKIPRRHEPFARAFGVTVEEMILITIINVLRDSDTYHETDLCRDVHMIHEEALQVSTFQFQPIDEGSDVFLAFILARLLFE